MKRTGPKPRRPLGLLTTRLIDGAAYSRCRELFGARSVGGRGRARIGASRSPPPPFVGSVLLEHLIVAGAATTGESRVGGTGIRRGAPNAGEGMQPILTRGGFGLAALRDDVFVVLRGSRPVTEPRHITAASFGIERLGQCRRCNARGCDRGNQGYSRNGRHGLSPGYEANKDPMPCLPLRRRSRCIAGIPSRLRDSPGAPCKNNLF